MFHKIDERTYRAHPALSRSLLDHIIKSPAHLKWAQENEQPDTDYFRLGRLVHAAVLEPDRFFSSTVIWTGARRFGKAWDEFQAKNSDKEILKPEEESQLTAMCNAVIQHCGTIDGQAEASVFWKHERTGLDLKARLDLVGNNYIYDLKTTQTASADHFMESVKNFGYHRQAAYYLDAAKAVGHPAEKFIFIAVEKTSPHFVQTFELDDAFIARGRLENEINLTTYKACKDSGEWPAYPKQAHLLRYSDVRIQGD